MPIANANGVDFHIQITGSGPTVVLLHGFMGNVATWYFTTAPVLARSHRVIMFDLRGHGKTQRIAEGYDIATMSRDLAAIVDLNTDESVTLVGHSYGAAVALNYAIEAPNRVKKLVLVEAPLPASNVDEVTRFSSLSTAEVIDVLPPGVKAALENPQRHTRRGYETFHFLWHQTTLRRDFEAARDIHDDVLSRVTTPTLCVYGTTSRCRPVGERLSRVMPNAKLVLLEGGHYLPSETPEELTRTIVDFVNG